MVPKHKNSNAGYGSVEINCGISGIEARLKKLLPINIPKLLVNKPRAVPKSPKMTPITADIIGNVIIINKISIPIFNIPLIYSLFLLRLFTEPECISVLFVMETGDVFSNLTTGVSLLINVSS